MLEGTFGRSKGAGTLHRALLRARQGFDEGYDLQSRSVSLFGPDRLRADRRTRRTLGATHNDWNRFSTQHRSSDVFAGVNLDAPQYAPFRAALLTNGRHRADRRHAARPRPVGDAGGSCGFCLRDQSRRPRGGRAFPTIRGLDRVWYGQRQQSSRQSARAAACAAVPPAVPERAQLVEDGRIHDDNFSTPARLAMT